MQLQSLLGLVLLAVASVEAAPGLSNNFDHSGALYKRSAHAHGTLKPRQEESRWARKCRASTNFRINIAPTSSPSPQPTQEQSQPQPEPEPQPQPEQPQPQPEPQPQPQPQPNNPGGDAGAFLSAHNEARARHGAAPLVWGDDLAGAAASWGSRCVFEHSGGAVGRFGENLAAGTGSMSPQAAVQAWMDEVVDYNPGNPVASHFTQVVWKGSQRLGCAVTRCPGGTIFGAASDNIVCEYDPPGNVRGRFPENVQK